MWCWRVRGVGVGMGLPRCLGWLRVGRHEVGGDAGCGAWHRWVGHACVSGGACEGPLGLRGHSTHAVKGVAACANCSACMDVLGFC